MIRFNGITPDMIQPGKLKCTSVGDRFAMQKNYQTVEQAGIIRSLVTNPTVRSINAQFLLRAKDLAELDLALQHVMEWIDCGEAKIQTREMEGVYYKARYSEITSPTYSGASCRFSVTFQCSDYRLYSENDDKPLSGADPGTDNFTFNGKHCLNDMGCMFVLDQKTVVPSITIHKYEIPGRAGTLRYDDYADYTLGESKVSGSLYLVNQDSSEPLSFEEQDKKLHEIAEWLITAKRAQLIWDSEPDYVYLAEVEEEATFTRSEWRNGKITLSFTVQPNSTLNEYHTYTSNETTYTSGYTTIDLDTLIPDGFTADTPLHIEITNVSGAVKKRITYIAIEHYADAQQSGNMTIGTPEPEDGVGDVYLDPGQKLIIDTETRTVSIAQAGVENAPQTIIESGVIGSFPYMAPSDPKILIAMSGYQIDSSGTELAYDEDDKAIAIEDMNASVVVTARGAML